MPILGSIWMHTNQCVLDLHFSNIFRQDNQTTQIKDYIQNIKKYKDKECIEGIKRDHMR